MNKDQKTVIEWCIESLTSEPEAWECDRYQCVHSTGVTVWTANDHYGMAIYANRDRSGGVIGGVTTSGSLFGAVIPWRRRLRRAALYAATKGDTAPEQVILSLIRAA